MGEVKIPNYPDNSTRPPVPVSRDDIPEREEKREHSEPVAKGTRKKKGLGRKLSETFIADDASSVKEYVIFDVLVPALKDTLYDIVSNSVSMFLFGGSGGSRRSTPNRSYNSISTSRRRLKSVEEPSRGPRIRPEDRKALYFDDIEFESITDANKVLNKLLWRLDEYKVVTVADFYDYAGITPDYTDSKYGWDDLRDAYVKRGYGGVYYIILPKAEYLA